MDRRSLLGISPSDYTSSNIRLSEMIVLCQSCKKVLVSETLCSTCIELLGNEDDYSDPQMDLFGDDQ